jgi:hypothetical protein
MHTKHLYRATPESGQLMPSYEMLITESATGKLTLNAENLESAQLQSMHAYSRGEIVWLTNKVSVDQAAKAGN